MTSNRAALLLAAGLILSAGCGNYSNEDLEFMNAVPDQSDISADMPVRSALLNTSEAELAKATHDVVATFNGMLGTVLAGIEAIRSYEPTSRGADSRTWGPIADSSAPGWQWQFQMTKQSDGSFTYEFDREPAGAQPDAWFAFVSGQFLPSPGVRRGTGSFTLDTGPSRAAGYPLDSGTAKIDTVTFSYATASYPINVAMNLVNYPNYPDLTTTNTVDYAYVGQSGGEGQMSFTIMGNLITATPAPETVAVVSRWLATGAGEANLTVESGDDDGLMQTECWDTSFDATYNDKPWQPDQDVGTPGDLSPCPQFPTL